MTSIVSTTIGPRRTSVLTRRWEAADPWAAILIVHGIAEHSGRYEHVGDHFVEHGIDVTSFDLPGFGASEGRRAHIHVFDDYTDDVEVHLAMIRERAPYVVVYGHSLGGLIALRYALSSHPQPDAYVLSAPALESTAPKALELLAKGLERVAPTLAVANPIKGEQLSRDPAIGDAYFADPLVHTKVTVQLGNEIMRAMEETRARLGEFSTPALVVHGGSDTLVTPQSTAILGTLPNVTRKLFPDFRHEPHNEIGKEEALDYIVTWIRERSGSR